MFKRKEEFPHWLADLRKQQEEINKEIATKEREYEIITMKIDTINHVSKKLKTNIFEETKKELTIVQKELRQLRDKRHDLSLIEMMVEQYTQTQSV
ncbi:hypothetical protein ACJEBK_28430 [Peribacillus frigoritolerans]|uniref:hypothetical protein n=1 Tax=Peribacillus frigoritolerans TaxID=450367 RepID=UPI0038716F0D